MPYVLCDFNINTSTLIDGKQNEDIFTNDIFKHVPYGAKIKNNKTKMCIFKNVFIPVIIEYVPESKYVELTTYCIKHMSRKFNVLEAVAINTIKDYFSKYEEIYPNISYICDIHTVLKDQFDLFYSDGSSSLKESLGAFGTVKLCEECETGFYDDLTEKKYSIVSFKGGVQNGTNNIGELMGIAKAIDMAGAQPIQIITSDSEYAIKSFREWYYSWEKNNFRAATGQPIKNKDLITNTMDKMRKSKKIFLFRWVKGHAKNTLNELCDSLAKEALEELKGE